MFRMYLPQILIGLGVILTFLGGLLSYIRSAEYDKNIEDKIEDTNKLSKENKSLAETNEKLSIQNQSLIEKNLELSSKNLELGNQTVKLSELINSNITGGDNFCYASISFSDNTNGLIVLHNDGEYPLSNVQVRFVEVDDNGNLLSENSFNVGEIPPKSVQIGGKTAFLMGTKKASFNIFFSARNGHLTQMLRLIYHDKKWLSATRVLDPASGKIHLEKIQDNFPVYEGMWH